MSIHVRERICMYSCVRVCINMYLYYIHMSMPSISQRMYSPPAGDHFLGGRIGGFVRDDLTTYLLPSNPQSAVVLSPSSPVMVQKKKKAYKKYYNQ